MVSIAEAILWGEQLDANGETVGKSYVSIAEAILWGEQHCRNGVDGKARNRFNRRGDSLGGATLCPGYPVPRFVVSIAEAILWGEQQQ